MHIDIDFLLLPSSRGRNANHIMRNSFPCAKWKGKTCVWIVSEKRKENWGNSKQVDGEFNMKKKFYQNENCLHTLPRDQYISMATLWFRRACDVVLNSTAVDFESTMEPVGRMMLWLDDSHVFHSIPLDFLWHLSSDCNLISRCHTHKASAENFIDWILINRVSTSSALKATQWGGKRRFHVQAIQISPSRSLRRRFCLLLRGIPNKNNQNEGLVGPLR